ncbi:MAG: hypothetical protein JRJ02_04895 [Deltaproteobacteria bacterium]|nr:hypothetical protein [Deltaproteobacteria bacterium]
MDQIAQILMERLANKGMEPGTIPGFIRNLANTLSVDPHTNLFHVNNQLRLLGWDDFELDYRTLELATAYLEAEGLKSLENKGEPDGGLGSILGRIKRA